MSRRRLLLVEDNEEFMPPVFHAPLKSDAVDIIGGLIGTVAIDTEQTGGSVSFTGEGCLFTGLSNKRTGGGIFFENLPIDVTNWSNSWTISYYAKNVSGFNFGHQLTVQFGRHVLGAAFIVYSPSYVNGNANNVVVCAYKGGNNIYIDSVNPTHFNQYQFNYEKIIWDATTSTFYLYVNKIFRGSCTITSSITLPDVYMNALSIGCGMTKNNGVVSCVNDYFMGVIRDVKIYNGVV